MTDQDKAVQEAERIAAADEYFKARAWIMDTTDNRRIFEAGFDRAYALLSKLRAPVADEQAAFSRAEISFPLTIPGNRVYLAGPMTGHENHNFPAFHAAAERLRGSGLEVVNPADHGLVSGLGWSDYMRWDLVKLAGCQAVYVLPGWEKSKGASLEISIARALGMPVFTVDGAALASAPVADELPHWEETSAKLERDETLTPLELFIHENEPAGGDADAWREQLAAALASAPVAGEVQQLPTINIGGKEHPQQWFTAKEVRQLLDAARASAPVAGEAQPAIVLKAVDEYGPQLDWTKHWVEYPIGTKFYAAPQARPDTSEADASPIVPGGPYSDPEDLIAALDAAPQASEAVRDAALEEAAQALDRLHEENRRWHNEFRDAAAVVRALKQRAALSAQPGAQRTGGGDEN